MRLCVVLVLVSGNALFGGLNPSLYLDPDRIEEKEEVRTYAAAVTKTDEACLYPPPPQRHL